MRVDSTCIGIAITSLFFSTAAMAADLTGEQITAAFSGNTTSWVSLKTKPMNPKWQPPWGSSYFSADGKLTGVKKSKPRTGSWRVSGDFLCVNWKQEKCRRVQTDGDQGYYLVAPNKNKRIVHVKKIVPGNQL